MSDSTSTEKVNVFHQWKAVISTNDTKDGIKEISIYVSKNYTLDQEDAEAIPEDDETLWVKVLTLPFPDGNEIEDENGYSVIAGPPSYFDASQLQKRFIPFDTFQNTIQRILARIESDIEAQWALKDMAKDSEWGDLL